MQEQNEAESEILGNLTNMFPDLQDFTAMTEILHKYIPILMHLWFSYRASPCESFHPHQGKQSCDGED